MDHLQKHLLAATLIISMCAQAQWTTNATHIYNTKTGNVGIGTTTLAYQLDITGTANISGNGVVGLLKAYNTIDGTINCERARLYWSCNAFHINTENESTSVRRNIQLFGHTFYWNNKTNVGGAWSWSHNTYIDGRGGIKLQKNGIICFGDAIYTHLSSSDIAIGRSVVGIMEINNGTLGTLRDLKLQNLISTGIVGIDTTTPQSKLAANGDIIARKVKVTQSGWTDYVFEPAYKLATLKEAEAFI